MDSLGLLSRSKRMERIRKAPVHVRAQLILHSSRRVREQVISQLRDAQVVEFLGYLDPDQVTDVLQCLPKRRGVRLVRKLGARLRDHVEFLLRFDPRTAAGMMSLDYVQVDAKSSFESVARAIRRHERRTGRMPAVLVVKSGVLVGELPLHAVVLARTSSRIEGYVRKVPCIEFNAHESGVLEKLRKHPHNKIVVLGDDRSILGVLYSDDILQLVERKSAARLKDFAGVRESEDVLDSPWQKVKSRYLWLILNLATAFLAASVVGLFEKTIAAFTLLAVYMPVIAGMGGNAGTQALVVAVRGIALKEVSLSSGIRVIGNEMLAGALNGVIVGALVALVAFLLNNSALLGLITGVAMVANLIVAGFFGTLIPLVINRLGRDPASSASIFITTATDVFGFFVFLGLARVVLGV